MKELFIDAKTENLSAVLAFIAGELESSGCSMKLEAQIAVAVEEIFVNIACYAYSPEVGGTVIRAAVGDEIVIEFEDKGKPYNPLERGDPDITLPAEERSVGGLGIYMVKKSMDSVGYRYEEGKNILTIRKLIG